jgi:hypothetical protein
MKAFLMLLVIMGFMSFNIQAADDATAEVQDTDAEASELAKRTEDVKKQVIQLNRDLFLLEEDLLHPASTRLSIYVSMDYGSFFSIDSVKLQLDGKPVIAFLYTGKDVEALKRGAIHPLFTGSISTGKHELVAIFTGIGPRKREYKRAVSLEFEKTTSERAFEIQVVDSSAMIQPEFLIKKWK